MNKKIFNLITGVIFIVGIGISLYSIVSLIPFINDKLTTTEETEVYNYSLSAILGVVVMIIGSIVKTK